MFALRIPLVICALAVAAFLAVPRPGGAGREEQYVVRAGDTLWELAATRYGGDPREGVWHIRRRNSLDARTLQPGMVLFLPAGAGGA